MPGTGGRVMDDDLLACACGHPDDERYAHHWASCRPWSTCLAHLEPEPCQTCGAYIAAGL